MSITLAFLVMWAHGVGAQSPILGPSIRLESAHVFLDTGVFLRRKYDSGNGYALEQSAYLGTERVKIGGLYRRQMTSAYTKDFLFPGVILQPTHDVRVTVFGPELLSKGSRWGISAEIGHTFAKRWNIRTQYGYSELNKAISMGIVLGWRVR